MALKRGECSVFLLILLWATKCLRIIEYPELDGTHKHH